jgi:hypothetical protein
MQPEGGFALSNTIVLSEDKDAANEELNQILIHPAPAIFLFIFGASEPVEEFAQVADSMASGALRRVVRRSGYVDILNRFINLPKNPGLPPLDSPDIVGFSTSGGLVVADVVRSADTLDAMRADDAFIRAEGT